MGGRRARIAIPVTYGLAVRYVLQTGLLEQLAGHVDPVVGLSWDDPALEARVRLAGSDVVRLPDAPRGGPLRKVDRMLDAAHDRRLASPTTTIGRRWRRDEYEPLMRPLHWARTTRDRLVVRLPGAEDRLAAEARALLDGDERLATFDRWLTDHAVDAVVSLTPYHAPDRFLLEAARRRGLPTIASIISFDNPTTRGRMGTVADRVLVWNEHNRGEVLRSYPQLGPDDVRVVGAPQFDLHADPRWTLPERTWRRALQLPDERPVVLYAAGPEILLPEEPALVGALAAALRAARLPEDPVLLLRGHPNDPVARWSDLGDEPGVVLSPTWGRQDGPTAWPDDLDIERQISTLRHAAVHLSICSTMAIDGAAVDRPVIAPTRIPDASRRQARRIRDFYRQEHWQPIAASGGVREVGSLDALVEEIASGLRSPGELAAQRRALVRSLLTHPDGGATARTVEEIVAVTS